MHRIGLGMRNERGQMLVIHSFKRNTIRNGHGDHQMDMEITKWSWRSPNGQVFNEIDYIMTSAITNTYNIQVINKINIGSVHRMVRAIIRLNTGLARIRLVKSNVRIADMDKLKDNVDNYNLELANHFSMLNTEERNLE